MNPLNDPEPRVREKNNLDSPSKTKKRTQNDLKKILRGEDNTLPLMTFFLVFWQTVLFRFIEKKRVFCFSLRPKKMWGKFFLGANIQARRVDQLSGWFLSYPLALQKQQTALQTITIMIGQKQYCYMYRSCIYRYCYKNTKVNWIQLQMK